MTKKKYKNSDELLPQFTKPEVYNVGDTVEVLPNVLQIGSLPETAQEKLPKSVGKQFEIMSVHDSCYGVFYVANCDSWGEFAFPHYCVKRVVPVAKKLTKQEIEKELGYKIEIIDDV